MKIVAISDTHGQHHNLEVPEGDMIIHAGDVSGKGSIEEVIDFLDWFKDLNFKYKIFVAGNHDFYFENTYLEGYDNIIPEGVHYLNDQSVEIEGINIWGSPIQPWFYDWAFNRRRGEDIAKHWALIPQNTDVLITHGPPFGVLDQTIGGVEVGCEDLMSTINRLNLKVHIFGHIHEAYGQVKRGNVDFINASVLDVNYQLINKPIEFIL